MRLFSWLLKKFLFAAVLTGAVLAGLGWWIYRTEGKNFAQQRQLTRQALQAETERTKAALAAVEVRLMLQPAAIAAQEMRARQAAGVAKELDELGSVLNRFTADGAQLRENEARLVRLKQMVVDATKRVGELKQELVRLQWEKDGVEIALDRTNRQMREAEDNQTPTFHFAMQVWGRFGDLVLGAVTLVTFGPAVVRFFISRRPPGE